MTTAMRVAWGLVATVVLGCLLFNVEASQISKMQLRYQRVEHHAPFYRSAIKNIANPSNQTVYGNILPVGIYWTTIQVGTPTQEFYVAIDSGSTDLVFPVSGCTGCHPQITGEYDPSNSKTSEVVSCHNTQYECQCYNSGGCAFAATYETCNLTAPTQPCTIDCQLYKDEINLGGQSTPGVFGAIYHQTKNFQQLFYIDGIMGFIPSGSSSYGGMSAFETLVTAGKYKNQFALCLNATKGGQITLGGYDESLMSGEFQYTPLLNVPYYATTFHNLQLNGVNVGPNEAAEIIIDSGTNSLLLPGKIYNNLKNKWDNTFCSQTTVPGACGSSSLWTGECYQYTADEISQFPSITLSLQGATLEITGEDYIVNTGNGTYCFGIQSSGTGPQALLIIGDVVMQAYYTLFDNVNKRLGWAPVNAEACMQ